MDLSSSRDFSLCRENAVHTPAPVLANGNGSVSHTFGSISPQERPSVGIVASIILPAYNEAKALPSVLPALLAAVDRSCEIIVVDDGSSDNTVEIASSYPVRVVKHDRNQGKGAAVRSGLEVARGKYIILMDADNTYPPEAIPLMVEELHKYDYVRCSRQHDSTNMPFINRIGNIAFDVILKLLNGMDGGDPLTGLYGLRREAIDKIGFTADGFDMEVEIGMKAKAHGLRTHSFPVQYRERLGEKKLNPLTDGWRILRRILSMTLLYKPGITFMLPGMIIWAIAAILVFVLSGGPLHIANVGMNVHGFIVAIIGATTGFQFMVFGVAAAMYRTHCGVPPSNWLLQLSDLRTRMIIAVGGVLLTVIGFTSLLWRIFSWVASGSGEFTGTREIVFDGSMIGWGLQVFMAVFFISIFAGQIQKKAKASAKQAEVLTSIVRPAVIVSVSGR